MFRNILVSSQPITIIMMIMEEQISYLIKIFQRRLADVCPDTQS